MFKLVLVVSLLAVVFLPRSCETAVAIYPKEEKPPEFACEEGCYLSHLNRVIGYGETFYNVGEECASYECQNNDQTIKSTCGVIGAGPGCKVVEGDLDLEYPNCCPSLVCTRKPKGPIYTLPTESPVLA